jgi:hypothetical protein
METVAYAQMVARVGFSLLVAAAGLVVAYTAGALWQGWWGVKPQPRPKCRVYRIDRHERWRGEDYDDVA